MSFYAYLPVTLALSAYVSGYCKDCLHTLSRSSIASKNCVSGRLLSAPCDLTYLKYTRTKLMLFMRTLLQAKLNLLAIEEKKKPMIILIIPFLYLQAKHSAESLFQSIQLNIVYKNQSHEVVFHADPSILNSSQVLIKFPLSLNFIKVSSACSSLIV